MHAEYVCRSRGVWVPGQDRHVIWRIMPTAATQVRQKFQQ